MSEKQSNEEKIKEEIHLLRSMDKKLEEWVSWRRNFKIGIARGVGIAVGTTIVAAFVLAILGWVISVLDEVPIIQDIIDKTNVKESIEN